MLRWQIPYLSPNTALCRHSACRAGLCAGFGRRTTAWRCADCWCCFVVGGCSHGVDGSGAFVSGLRAQRADAQVPVTHPALVASDRRRCRQCHGGRIVWLLFDELSYDQTFEHRFPGLAMPAFDEFKSESVVFTRSHAGGVLPPSALFLHFFWASRSDNIRSGLDGEPMVKFAGSNSGEAFDAHATLFSDAQRLGWTTGVVGWYNPYCRILAGTLELLFLEDGRRAIGRSRSRSVCLENARWRR